MQRFQSENPERRFDSQDAQRILELASRLQQRHVESVSAKQIEQIAAEVGIAPEFVRRALTMLEATPTAPEPVEARLDRLDDVLALPATAPTATITQEVLRQALAPSALLGFFDGALAMALSRGGEGSGPGHLLLMALPALALIQGWRAKEGRLGALSGATLGGMALLGLLMGSLVIHPPGPRVDDLVPLLLAALGGGATLGGLGGTLRRWYERLPKK